jgi:hypothetical protein
LLPASLHSPSVWSSHGRVGPTDRRTSDYNDDDRADHRLLDRCPRLLPLLLLLPPPLLLLQLWMLLLTVVIILLRLERRAPPRRSRVD